MRPGIRDVAFLARLNAGSTFDPESISGLQLWLDANSESYADGDTNDIFSNRQSALSARDYTGISGITFKQGITPKGTHVFRYAAGAISAHASTYNLRTTAITTAVEAFIVLASIGPPSTGYGPVRFGNAGSTSFYPTGGRHYFDVGSTTRNNYVIVETITDFHVLNHSATAGNATVRVNGTQRFTTASNTFGMEATTYVGQGGGNGFSGDIAEILLYDHILTTDERAEVEAYLQSKHIA